MFPGITAACYQCVRNAHTSDGRKDLRDTQNKAHGTGVQAETQWISSVSVNGFQGCMR